VVELDAKGSFGHQARAHMSFWYQAVQLELGAIKHSFLLVLVVT